MDSAREYVYFVFPSRNPGRPNFFSAYLCVPLRLCRFCFQAIYRRGAEERRDYAEKIFK